MGGFLSGRQNGRPTVEGCGSLVIAIDKLTKRGKGRSRFGVVLSGGFDGDPHRIVLVVTLGPDGRGQLTISHEAFQHLSTPVRADHYTVELIAIPWQCGGRRWFMLCPRLGRRVLKLYLPNGAQRFASRQAMGLAYRVQRLDSMQKGHARIARAFAKLGASYSGLDEPTPPKPKWMRHKTYDRLVADIEDAEKRHELTANDYLVRRMLQLIS